MHMFLGVASRVPGVISLVELLVCADESLHVFSFVQQVFRGNVSFSFSLYIPLFSSIISFSCY